MFQATTTKLTYGSTQRKDDDFCATVLIGKKDCFKRDLIAGVDSDVFEAMLDSISGDSGSASTFLSSKKQLHLCVLPSTVSRNNHDMSAHTITSLLQSACPSKGHVKVIICGSTDIAPLASAVAKAFPLFNCKTSNDDENNNNEREIYVTFLDENGEIVDKVESLQAAEAVSEGVRLAARLVDTHPEELTTDAYANECRVLVQELDHTTLTEIVGEDLKDCGYGGLYGVGRAATCPPRMLILEYDPPNSDKTVALVGKGIVYDTGGLALKPKTGMCGMKHDMGGSAGLLGGFCAAVKLKTPKKLFLVLCLAENAIGPTAFRNDDILRMYSGKTVEINNSDAEGRLVLADGVAHATRNFKGLDLCVDMATLTGAQMITTGKKHAGILANSEELQQRAQQAGLYSGDLAFPLLYAPELLKDEFKSEVADMKNSVKDRGNAQASCAGHFIESHLHKDYQGGWLHVDMAGPGSLDERGTGYGVGLVLALLEAPGF